MELPEIRVDVSLDEWNRLLKEYDRDSNTAEYIHCNVEYKSKGEQHYYQDAAIRLRGNTSRRRPEGNGGYRSQPAPSFDLPMAGSDFAELADDDSDVPF